MLDKQNLKQTLERQFMKFDWFSEYYFTKNFSKCLQRLENKNFYRYLKLIQKVPIIDKKPLKIISKSPFIGVDSRKQAEVTECAYQLKPWRKGPLKIGNVLIDSEWQSNLKWDRISPHIDLKNAIKLFFGELI